MSFLNFKLAMRFLSVSHYDPFLLNFLYLNKFRQIDHKIHNGRLKLKNMK
jgi:hypothetical protein